MTDLNADIPDAAFEDEDIMTGLAEVWILSYDPASLSGLIIRGGPYEPGKEQPALERLILTDLASLGDSSSLPLYFWFEIYDDLSVDTSEVDLEWIEGFCADQARGEVAKAIATNASTPSQTAQDAPGDVIDAEVIGEV